MIGDRPRHRIPTSTYRLQVRPSFDLDRVADLIDYLAELGVDWLYLSPLLESAAGSEHGYDVVDHDRVDPSRGGRPGLERVAAAAHAAGMGVLVDIVPNHVSVADASRNAWWWSVLRDGPASPYATAFDIDWAFGGGRVRIPVLADPSAVTDLRIEGDELRYGPLRFPIAPGTADEPAGDDADPVAVHDRQHYELVDWRRADAELNYRRFFAVSTLAAIRVEDEQVFDAAHREIGRWFADGLVDGLRVDHPDGLRDPAGYLDRLARLTRGAYTLVEKILEPGERLPAGWATAGTTGYDTLGLVDRVLVDPAGRATLDALETELAGGPVDWAELVHAGKRQVAETILGSEIRRVVRDLGAGDDPGTIDAVAEVAACFPVYRSYLPAGRDHLDQALAAARRRRPERAEILDRIGPLLGDPTHPAALRFQQTTGMIMAKGVEDTAFYRYSRLTALNEVGADPGEFAVSVERFHAEQADRLARHPTTMTTLTTHDTKRSEDTRARILALAEIPGDWSTALHELRTLAPVGDGPLESLVWQAMVGAWPADRSRLHGYAEKAAREAARSTSWNDPDQEFEVGLHAAVDAAFDRPEVRAVLDRVLDLIAAAGWSNGLVGKLLQLLGPGVPDVYQGTELWDRSLVDPDNRRPVDFAERRRLLGEVRAGALPPVDATGAAKLLITHRALQLRRGRPELFTGYRPVRAAGLAADHVVAFDRGGAIAVGTRLPIGLARCGGWRNTTVQLPAGGYQDVITGRRLRADDGLLLATVLDRYPVAALIGPEDES